MGYVKIRKIELVPEIEIDYLKDHKEEKGNISISLKNGFWLIDYVFKCFTYYLHEGDKQVDIYLDITDVSQKVVWEKDEKTGKFYIKAIANWLIKDYKCDFKVFTHSIEEIEGAEELIEPKVTKSIPEGNLEYYRKDKILKIPFFNDEIRINIENENLEYIRNNKKLIKVFPLNKELHLYGIKPEAKIVYTSQ